MKPKYKYKPRVAALNEDGISERDLSDLNFNVPAKNPTNKHTYLRRKKNDETKDIKKLVGNFFDKPDKGQGGHDRSFDYDKQFYIAVEHHKGSSTISDEYDSEADIY